MADLFERTLRGTDPAAYAAVQDQKVTQFLSDPSNPLNQALVAHLEHRDVVAVLQRNPALIPQAAAVVQQGQAMRIDSAALRQVQVAAASKAGTASASSIGWIVVAGLGVVVLVVVAVVARRWLRA